MQKHELLEDTIIAALYRIRVKIERPMIDVCILVDTSGSMFEKISGSIKTQLDWAKELMAVEYALGVAASIIEKIAKRARIDGHIGFFSSKERDFTCGPRDSCITLVDYIRMQEKPYVDYLSLRNTTTAVAKMLKKERQLLNVSTGGTDPNPLLHYLTSRYQYDIVFIVTDGWTPPIELRDIYTVIYIVPGGEKPEVKGKNYRIYML